MRAWRPTLDAGEETLGDKADRREWSERLPSEFDGARRFGRIRPRGDGRRLRELRRLPRLQQRGEERLIAFDEARFARRSLQRPQLDQQVSCIFGFLLEPLHKL